MSSSRTGILRTALDIVAGRKRHAKTSVFNIVGSCFKRLRMQTEPKALRLRECVSLGDRRFVSIVEVDGDRLLIAGTATQIVLLTKLKAVDQGTPEAGAGRCFTEALIAASSSEPGSCVLEEVTP